MKEIVITERRKIVVQKANYKGNNVLDIRTYVKTDKYTGPTKKGINIPVAKAEELVRAILAELGVQVAGR